MDKDLRFESAIFCSESNCNLLRFSAHNLSLLLIFFLLFLFLINNVLTTVNTTDIAITILQKAIV